MEVLRLTCSMCYVLTCSGVMVWKRGGGQRRSIALPVTNSAQVHGSEHSAWTDCLRAARGPISGPASSALSTLKYENTFFCDGTVVKSVERAARSAVDTQSELITHQNWQVELPSLRLQRPARRRKEDRRLNAEC